MYRPGCPQTQTSLQWVEDFTYLGIRVTQDLQSFQHLNLQLVVIRLKDHSSRWADLPLNLLGHINILKMIYLPKFIYIFRNCPTWIPLSFFRDLDSCIGSFLWRGPSPGSTLQLPETCGGLALPKLLVYYWAAMFLTVRWWFEQSRANAAVCLEAAIVGSLTELSNLVYRGSRMYPSLPDPTKVTLWVWGVARQRFLHPNRWSPYCPLWGNPSLPHFMMIPDLQLRARFGVRILKDVIPTGSLLSFRDLVSKHDLPEWMLFRYHQLRHATRAQFPMVPSLKANAIEELLA